LWYFGRNPKRASPREEIERPSYQVVAWESSQAGLSQRVDIRGDHFSVISGPGSPWQLEQIRFDDLSNPPLPLRPGFSFDLPFERFYLETTDTGNFLQVIQDNSLVSWRFFIGRNGARFTPGPENLEHHRMIANDHLTFTVAQSLLGFLGPLDPQALAFQTSRTFAVTIVNRGVVPIRIDNLAYNQKPGANNVTLLYPDEVWTYRGKFSEVFLGGTAGIIIQPEPVLSQAIADIWTAM